MEKRRNWMNFKNNTDYKEQQSGEAYTTKKHNTTRSAQKQRSGSDSENKYIYGYNPWHDNFMYSRRKQTSENIDLIGTNDMMNMKTIFGTTDESRKIMESLEKSKQRILKRQAESENLNNASPSKLSQLSRTLHQPQVVNHRLIFKSEPDQEKFKNSESERREIISPLRSENISTNNSYIPKMQCKPETLVFLNKLEALTRKNEPLAEPHLESIRKIVYSDLDDIIIADKEVKLGVKIGQGSSSEVLHGSYMYCSVAIKKIKISLYSGDQLWNILSEILFLKKARHPNIVMVVGLCINNENEMYILSEFCNKRSLKDFYQSNEGNISNDLKYKMLFDLSKALFFMHCKTPQVIHRDIKPENVFITEDWKAKLGDFGIWKIVKPQENILFPDLTSHQSGTVGTLRYMAPESMSKSIYSTASDIYAFGILAWELFKEKQAFEGKEGFQLVDFVVSQKGRLSFANMGIKDKVQTYLSQWLNFNPDDRWTANELWEAFSEIL